MFPTKNGLQLIGVISSHKHGILFVSKSSLRLAFKPFLT